MDGSGSGSYGNPCDCCLLLQVQNVVEEFTQNIDQLEKEDKLFQVNLFNNLITLE